MSKPAIGLATAAGALVVAVGATAAIATSGGPDYDPGKRPAVAKASAATEAQVAVVPALGRAATPADKLTGVAAQSLTIGRLYESGVVASTVRVGASDGAHRVAVAAAKNDEICVLGIADDGTSASCQSPEGVKAGRLMTADYEPGGGVRFSGVVAGKVDTVSFEPADGGAVVKADVIDGTYVLSSATQSGGTLKIGTRSVPIPNVG